MPAYLLPWQFAADPRSSVLGSPPPCLAISNNSSPLTFQNCLAEKQPHASVNRSESALSSNPCAESFSLSLQMHCFPISTLLHALAGWPPGKASPGILVLGFWLGSAREETAGGLACCNVRSVLFQDPEWYNSWLTTPFSPGRPSHFFVAIFSLESHCPFQQCRFG